MKPMPDDLLVKRSKRILWALVIAVVLLNLFLFRACSRTPREGTAPPAATNQAAPAQPAR